jgi:hypothetical protein
MSRLSILAMIFIAVPALAAAQHGGGAGGRASAAAAPSRSATAIPRAAAGPARASARVQSGTQSAGRVGGSVVHGRNTGRPIRRGNGANFGSNGNFNGTNFQDVPGLGFDYPHLAAISGNRRGRGGRFGGGAPFGFSGFLLSPSIITDDQPAEDSQSADAPYATDEQQTPEDAPQVQREPRRSRGSRSAEAQPESAPAPPRDVEQYVFVRRDGSLVFAVAYTWENGTLRYITPDGLRRSIGRDALDLNATQQFNEQRGVDFRAPA